LSTLTVAVDDAVTWKELAASTAGLLPLIETHTVYVVPTVDGDDGQLNAPLKLPAVVTVTGLPTEVRPDWQVESVVTSKLTVEFTGTGAGVLPVCTRSR
jgi:hypothetical protein